MEKTKVTSGMVGDAFEVISEMVTDFDAGDRMLSVGKEEAEAMRILLKDVADRHGIIVVGSLFSKFSKLGG